MRSDIPNINASSAVGIQHLRWFLEENPVSLPKINASSILKINSFGKTDNQYNLVLEMFYFSIHSIKVPTYVLSLNEKLSLLLQFRPLDL